MAALGEARTQAVGYALGYPNSWVGRLGYEAGEGVMRSTPTEDVDISQPF
jgi:hypothetical protein